MKLVVSLLIACVLFNKVYSLKCYECLGQWCKPKNITCPFAQICGSRSVVSFIGEQKTVLSERRCVQPEDCISGSMNLGLKGIEINTKCCTTDLCNAESVPEYKEHSFNGKKCFTCSEKDCTSTVSCRGDENRCVNMTEIAGGQTIISKGCISNSFCAAAHIPVPYRTIVGCCEGDLCNEAHSHAGLSLLLLSSLACFSLFL